MSNSLMEQLSEKFKSKRVLIVGLGLQGGGVGMARFFTNLGAIVKVTDLKTEEELLDSLKLLGDIKVTYTLGKHDINDFLDTDFIFKGPSMPWDNEYLIQAENKGIPIDMEVAFTVEHLQCKTIGITGTRGKTTTTEMIFELLNKTGRNIYKGGNLTGESTINLLSKIKEYDIVVLELSSWSLSAFHKKKISPNIAVFTNFYPDHLNYYKNMDDYFYDKKAIYMYQKASDFCFINKQLEDRITKDEAKGNLKFFDKNDFTGSFKYLRGDLNRENAAAALLVSKLFNINEREAIKDLQNYKSALYRQETVKVEEKITFVNDSTSTTPTSTIKAINAFNDKQIILIMGGNSKNLPVKKLTEELAKVEFIVLIHGDFTDQILKEIKNKYTDKISPIFLDLKEAIRFAYNKAKDLNKESYVLFSPGATSFAMFKNEFDRGDKFNEYVKTY